MWLLLYDLNTTSKVGVSSNLPCCGCHHRKAVAGVFASRGRSMEMICGSRNDMKSNSRSKCQSIPLSFEYWTTSPELKDINPVTWTAFQEAKKGNEQYFFKWQDCSRNFKLHLREWRHIHLTSNEWISRSEVHQFDSF